MFERKRALERIANEKVLYKRRGGGDLPVCVIYPNIYRLGMANLGFQGDLSYLRFGAASCRRACLPADPDERDAIRSGNSHLVSLEEGRSLADFEILAFSISFETDYLNVLTILRMAGIPPRRADRVGRSYPLIIAGGSAVFLNPEPIADFIDLFLIGEGEEMVPEFLDLYGSERSRDDRSPLRAARLAGVEGAYLPDYFDPASTTRAGWRMCVIPGPARRE